MEVQLACFFNKVFSDLQRNSLRVRYERRSLVDRLSTFIEGCIRGEICDAQAASRNAVKSAIRYHEEHLSQNHSVCIISKYHNILYVAAKISFDWQLRDSATVASLLDNMFTCEGTFERLLIGAILGTGAPYFIAGSKSDFLDQEENVRAMVFFLDHARTARLKYCLDDEYEPTRFIDVPIYSCGKTAPVKIALQHGAPDILHILLRFGAIVSEDAEESGLEALLERLKDCKRVYPFNLVSCLKLILRVIESVRVYPQYGTYVPESNVEGNCFLDKFPHFVDDLLVPETRCGVSPPELKHLCRCAIRYRLWQNYHLPNGIQRLHIPESLQKYLDLFSD